MACRHSQTLVRRDHYRRRRPRSGDGLLPGGEPRHHQRGSARAQLHRLRQCRPQHHSGALQLQILDGNTQFFEHSLKLWEGLVARAQLQRHALPARPDRARPRSPAQLDVLARKGNIMRLNGIDAELLDRGDVMRLLPVPGLHTGRRASRSTAGCCSGAPGTVRHDAVAWGYARAASALGVDIIENCEVTGFVRDGERVERRRDQPRPDPRRPHRDLRRRALLAGGGDGRAAAARREPPAAGLRERADQALRRPRDQLRRRALLYLPVRQGRAGVRRRTSTASTATPSAASSRRCRPWPNARWRSFPRSRACGCCVTGAASRT